MSKKRRHKRYIPDRRSPKALVGQLMATPARLYTKAECQTMTDKLLETAYLPRFSAMSKLDHSVGRFDQCVIDRGAGMLQRLQLLQGQLYENYSDFKKLFSHVSQDNAWKQRVQNAVFGRLAAYHDLVDGVAGAYDRLIALAAELESGLPLVELSQLLERGGAAPKVERARIAARIKTLDAYKRQVGAYRYDIPPIVDELLNALNKENTPKARADLEYLDYKTDKDGQKKPRNRPQKQKFVSNIIHQMISRQPAPRKISFTTTGYEDKR